ncbi:MAG: acyl-CoA dehydrogenase family protein, partial [Anaerolineales bacterium]|nr:acyl-CoA dehydrogenase family protein [Anaerolineales bacterium]
MYFTEEHEALRQMVRKFVDNEINPHVEKWEEEGMFPAHKLFKKLGDLGLLGLMYPEEYGGGGMDYSYQTVFLEEIGRIDCGGVPMGITVQTDMATPTLAQFGTPEQKEKFLRPAISGEAVFSIAVSEPDAGSDVASIRTYAVRDGDDYVINGSKMWITNGTQADYLTMLVRTSNEEGYKGMSLIVVPSDTPGFSVSRKLDKLGMRSSDTAILAFDDMRVPVANRIGPEGKGFYLQMQQFQVERLSAAITGIGSMRKVIDMTIKYCREREAFGQPLLNNQWIYFKLSELITELEAFKQLVYYCVDKHVKGEDMTREASMAKLKLGRLSRQVADTCIQFHGGMGY